MDAPAQSYFSVVGKYWKSLTLITIIPTIIVVLLVFLVLTPLYKGKCSVIFPLKSASSFMRASLTELDIPVSGMSQLLNTQPTLYNHIAIIESRTLAERVYNYMLSEHGVDLLPTYPKIAESDRSEEQKMQRLFTQLKKKVDVDDSDRGMAVVTFIHKDAEISAMVANAYVTETLAFLNEVNQSTQGELVVFLEARQTEVEETLRETESEIQVVKEDTGILSVEEHARQLISSYADIEALGAQAEIDYQGSLSQANAMANAGMDMEEFYEYLEVGQEPPGEAPVPAIEALEDSAVGNLRAELAEAEMMRQQMLLYSTPDNPDMIILENQIGALTRELYREFSGYYDASVASLMVETTAYRAQLDVAEEIKLELDRRLDEFPPDERRLIELERDRDVQESIFLVVTQELEQARIQELREEEPFTVLDEALVPTKPFKPRKLMLTFATFGIAFWIGIFVIFSVDAGRRRNAAVQASGGE